MGANQGPKETFKMSTLLVENVTSVETTPKDLTKEEIEELAALICDNNSDNDVDIERCIVGLAVDLVGIRREEQKKVRRSVINRFLHVVFEGIEERIKINPFKKWYSTSIGKTDFKEFDQIVSIINLENSLEERLSHMLSPKGIDKVEIELGEYTVSVLVRFKD